MLGVTRWENSRKSSILNPVIMIFYLLIMIRPKTLGTFLFSLSNGEWKEKPIKFANRHPLVIRFLAKNILSFFGMRLL